jgi:hypothetical protein
MREIRDHIVEGDLPQNQLALKVIDEPGSGGANHRYEISWPGGVSLDDNGKNVVGTRTLLIEFQNGPIKEAGLNGVTQEVLLAIVIDRLKSFQAGPFPSHYNEEALFQAQNCLFNLQGRTRERIARGVEGKTEK